MKPSSGAKPDVQDGPKMLAGGVARWLCLCRTWSTALSVWRPRQGSHQERGITHLWSVAGGPGAARAEDASRRARQGGFHHPMLVCFSVSCKVRVRLQSADASKVSWLTCTLLESRSWDMCSWSGRRSRGSLLRNVTVVQRILAHQVESKVLELQQKAGRWTGLPS